MVDSAGSVRSRYLYTPYGERTRIEGNLDCHGAFTGHWEHEKSKLLLAWFRAYDSTTGRWLSTDPLGEGVNAMGNLYNYVGNDSINSIDLFGLCDLNLFSNDDKIDFFNSFRSMAEKYTPKNLVNFFTVSVHGNATFVADERRGILPTQKVRMYPSDLKSEILKHKRWRKGITIVLDSCNTGKGKNSFGQKLADELVTPVLAPAGYVDPKGRLISYKGNPRGNWRLFRPGMKPLNLPTTFDPW